MALYISAGQRRRKVVLTAAVCAVIALLVGLGLGRATAPSPATTAQDAKALAKVATGQLQAFPIHYDEVSRGQGDRAAFYASLDAGLTRATDDLTKATDEAAWLDEAAKQQLKDQIRAIRTLADANAPAAEFDAAVARAVSSINSAFGAVTPSSSAASTTKGTTPG